MRAKVLSIKKSTTNQGKVYYKVDLEDEKGGQLSGCLCFDSKIEGVGNGLQELDVVTKGDTRYINFGKEKQGGGFQKSPRNDRYNLLLQTHTMPMAYAKDVVCALIEARIKAGQEVKSTEIGGVMISLYRVLREAILEDVQLANHLKGGQ